MEELLLDDTILAKEKNLERTEFAGFWIRVGASLLDFIILLPIYGLGIYNTLSLKSLSLMLLLTVASAVYKPLLEWKYSATFGKQLVKIKVVDGHLNNITGMQALARYFPWVISILFSAVSNIYLFLSPSFQNIDDYMQIGTATQAMPLHWIGSLWSFIFLFLVGSVAFDKRKQGVHDKVAKTYCIKVK